MQEKANFYWKKVKEQNIEKKRCLQYMLKAKFCVEYCLDIV